MISGAFDINSITGLTADSRAVKPGYLFAALPGVKSHGADYIPQVIEAGAKVLLVGSDVRLPKGAENLTIIYDENPRRKLAELAAAFYKAQPDFIAAVTGTNGKTSVVHFAQQIWEQLGEKVQSVGTLSGNLTTPDPVILHERLAEYASDGVTHLALEASSHGLEQNRLDGVKIKAAGFTNLSRDHLDYHGDMEAYLGAKERLFAELLPENGTAVLNADIPEFKALKEICDARGIDVMSYGYAGEHLRLLGFSPSAMSSRRKPESRVIKEPDPGFRRDDKREDGDGKGKGNNTNLNLNPNLKIKTNLNGLCKILEVAFPLVGEFQLMNALCALGLVLAEKPERAQEAIQALSNLKSVPGRLEAVGEAPIYIDYAHTPEALENALATLRPYARGRLICVFGCGGDRDKGKRPLMGQAVAQGADLVFVTDDNPRTEEPAAIRKAILSALPKAIEIPDRAAAIRAAITEMNEGDVLLIAGKGHEQGQIIGAEIHPFCDKKEALKCL